MWGGAEMEWPHEEDESSFAFSNRILGGDEFYFGEEDDEETDGIPRLYQVLKYGICKSS